MQHKQSVNVCRTCKRQPECVLKEIFERDTCDQYVPLSLDELVMTDRFTSTVMVGACPRCGSDNTYDCESQLELTLDDPTVGYCLDCYCYWCLECGYQFESEKQAAAACRHWATCGECYKEHGYLFPDEFIKQICPICEYFENACQLEDPSECKKEGPFLCPFNDDVSRCPQIQELLKKQL